MEENKVTIQDFEAAFGQYKQAVADKIGDLETRVVALEQTRQSDGDMKQAVKDVMDAMADLKGQVAVPPQVQPPAQDASTEPAASSEPVEPTAPSEPVEPTEV